MKGGRSFRRWLLNMPPPPPQTRLSAAEAVALAAADPEVQALGIGLSMPVAVDQSDRLIWRVSSGTIDTQWWVEVDDATGAVGDVHQASGFSR